MGPVLLDTHVWAWTLTYTSAITAAANEAIDGATAVYVSPVSFYEIGQKVRLGKWPTMEPVVPRLSKELTDQGGLIAPLTAEICLDASLRDWSHRDPFDRLLAVTCERLGAAMVTRDPAFTAMGVACIW
jgi:PIN domain nuclease of toxin-antitoxin system